MLSVYLFKRIVALFGQPDIDLFAGRLNAQVETYVSWKPHPIAKFVDAFTVDWSQFFLLCISPFLSYFQMCAKNNPKPGNRNFDNPEVDNSAILYSCTGPSDRHITSSVLRASAQNLAHPTRAGPHPLQHRLELLVCKLSGNPCKSQSFRQTL